MKLNFLIFLFTSIVCLGQNSIDLEAVFSIENKQIVISQTITYQNTSQDTLQTIFLNDWNHGFSSKKTPLAQRLAEEYKSDFHLAKDIERGFTTISSIRQDKQDLAFERPKDHPDVIKVELIKSLKPSEIYNINLQYKVQIPSDKFTDYGLTPSGDLNLRYWYITPAVYNGAWQYYSHKDLDDLFIPTAQITFNIEYPNNYVLTSELNTSEIAQKHNNQFVKLSGNNRKNTKLFLNKIPTFETMQTKGLAIVSNIEDEGLDIIEKVLITEKVTHFILENLGDYPHEKLLLTNIDYKKDPVYGLNFLPNFVHPYPDNFKYELKILKIALHNYLENTLLINPRKEQWLLDGLQIFYVMNYVEKYYPDMKFLGSIANYWGVRSFHAADLNFNDKYVLAYMLMTRTNRDQPLAMQKDSLLKFNKNIANKFKAGVGLKYLDDFVNEDVVETALESFLKETKLKQTSTKEFESFLKAKTSKDIDWFFNDYLLTRKKIDFKIKKVKTAGDSITVTIKNKRHNKMPISLFAMNNDSITSKTWIENITGHKTITIPRNKTNKLVLNYNQAIPEINLRDNWKSLKGFFYNNKPLQFRLFQDVEDPNYNQVFFMPIIEFNNIYDGLTLGIKAYNKTLLRKRLIYKLEPQYSFKSKSLTGSALVWYTHNLENNNLYAISYGIGTSYKSYDEDLFVRKIIPSLSFSFREDNDFRSNKRNQLNFRYLDINRDKDLQNPLNISEPNYNIFNIRYINSNDNLINFSKWYADYQLAKTFSKISFNYEYRRLFESNRQLNLRFYAGTFLNNNNDPNSNYFSFALDRPTDYLFEYNYLGRSESIGIFSQQYITAEGGFKSKLETPYANQWISTLNASTTLWKYVLAYGDIGYLKNKFNSPNLVYDSGIRINLVTDYFEIYLPIYSNLGWEIGQPNYDQKIRFKFTLDPKSLLGLFRRRWY